MRKETLKDKYLKVLMTCFLVVLFGYTLFLLSGVLVPVKSIKTSNVPTLNKEKLVRIDSLMNSRQDINTNGKPDTTGFSYENEEPFR